MATAARAKEENFMVAYKKSCLATQFFRFVTISTLRLGSQKAVKRTECMRTESADDV